MNLVSSEHSPLSRPQPNYRGQFPVSRSRGLIPSEIQWTVSGIKVSTAVYWSVPGIPVSIPVQYSLRNISLTYKIKCYLYYKTDSFDFSKL